MPGQMAALAQEWDHAWLVTAVDNTNPHGFPQQRNDVYDLR
jgi:hypothetical protein